MRGTIKSVVVLAALAVGLLGSAADAQADPIGDILDKVKKIYSWTENMAGQMVSVYTWTKYMAERQVADKVHTTHWRIVNGIDHPDDLHKVLYDDVPAVLDYVDDIKGYVERLPGIDSDANLIKLRTGDFYHRFDDIEDFVKRLPGIDSDANLIKLRTGDFYHRFDDLEGFVDDIPDLTAGMTEVKGFVDDIPGLTAGMTEVKGFVDDIPALTEDVEDMAEDLEDLAGDLPEMIEDLGEILVALGIEGDLVDELKNRMYLDLFEDFEDYAEISLALNECPEDIDWTKVINQLDDFMKNRMGFTAPALELLGPTWRPGPNASDEEIIGYIKMRHQFWMGLLNDNVPEVPGVKLAVSTLKAAVDRLVDCLETWDAIGDDEDKVAHNERLVAVAARLDEEARFTDDAELADLRGGLIVEIDANRSLIEMANARLDEETRFTDDGELAAHAAAMKGEADENQVLIETANARLDEETRFTDDAELAAHAAAMKGEADENQVLIETANSKLDDESRFTDDAEAAVMTDTIVIQVDENQARIEIVDSKVDLLMEMVEKLEFDLLRERIEQGLMHNDQLAFFYMPEALGGHLEDVRQVVVEAVTQHEDAGMSIGNAWAKIGTGDSRLDEMDWKGAWGEYRKAYTQLVTGNS
jgi:hypothetical protein